MMTQREIQHIKYGACNEGCNECPDGYRNHQLAEDLYDSDPDESLKKETFTTNR